MTSSSILAPGMASERSSETDQVWAATLQSVIAKISLQESQLSRLEAWRDDDTGLEESLFFFLVIVLPSVIRVQCRKKLIRQLGG